MKRGDTQSQEDKERSQKVAAFLKRLGRDSENYIKTKLMRRWRYVRPPSDRYVLYYRTGLLRKHIESKYSSSDEIASVEIGPLALRIATRRMAWSISEDYARTSIYPASRSYLAVPLRPALDAMGQKLVQSPRQWASRFGVRLRFLRTRNLARRGAALLVMRSGPNLVPVYLLKKRVIVPGRRLLRQTVDNVIIPRLKTKEARELLHGARVLIHDRVVYEVK